MDLKFLSPEAIKHKKRSQSMDGVVPVLNKNCSNILQTSCYTENILGTRVPITVHGNFSLYKSCEKNCSSYDRPNRRKSFNSSLHSIDETESIDFQRTRKRELCVSNIYSDKRLSDPLIRCSFTNKGFDIQANNQRYFSQLDNYLDTLSDRGDGLKNNNLPYESPPKIKVRISDEWGNRIDNSLDYQSDCSDVDDFWDFGTTKDHSSHECADSVVDAFHVVQNAEATSKCRKCGHRLLKTQFSTSFS